MLPDLVAVILLGLLIYLWLADCLALAAFNCQAEGRQSGRDAAGEDQLQLQLHSELELPSSQQLAGSAQCPRSSVPLNGN